MNSFDIMVDAPFNDLFYVVRHTGDRRPLDLWTFKTREFAEIHKDLCERLEQIRFDHAKGNAAGLWVVRCDGPFGFRAAEGGHLTSSGRVSIDGLAFGALVARWTAPLHFKLRRVYEVLMWGERGRV